MKIGIIGISTITLNLAFKAAAAGHKVLISNPRGNNLIKEAIQNTRINVKLVSLQKAALTDLLILFTPFQDIENLVTNLPDMKEKIILHTNNAYFFGKFLPITSFENSPSKILSFLLPSAHVIRLYNILNPSTLVRQNIKEDQITIFYEGDDKNAKKKAKEFLETLGFSAFDLNERKR